MMTRNEWFASLEWNRRNQIENFLAATAGASPEHSLVFARWLVCAAWRTLEPGAKAFSVGFRGIGETDCRIALEALADPWLGVGILSEGLPSKFKTQVLNRIVVFAKTSDRRDFDSFALLAARSEDFIGDDHEPIERTFVVACTLSDDETLPKGFQEIRVTGFDVEAMQRERNNLFAEAKECAVAAMLKTSPNKVVSRKRRAWEVSYGS